MISGSLRFAQNGTLNGTSEHNVVSGSTMSLRLQNPITVILLNFLSLKIAIRFSWRIEARPAQTTTRPRRLEGSQLPLLILVANSLGSRRSERDALSDLRLRRWWMWGLMSCVMILLALLDRHLVWGRYAE